MRKILVMNGPNLDMLGTREPEIYGHDTLETLEDEVVQYGARHGVEVECFQSNSEGELVEKIHLAPAEYDGIVYNPGAHTHYSYALRDAVGSIDTPVVEVHLSDIDEREPFRQISVIAPACIAQVKGLGIEGYCRAIDILCQRRPRLRLGNVFEQVTTGQNVVTATEVDEAAAQRDRRLSHAARSERRGSGSAENMVLFGNSPARDESVPMQAAASGPSFEPAPLPVPESGPAPASAPEPSPAPAPAPESGFASAPASAPVHASASASALTPESAPVPNRGFGAGANAATVHGAGANATPAPSNAANAVPAPGANAAPAPEPSHAAAPAPAPEPRPVNYAEAYAGAVASVDAGLLSFERQGVVRNACKHLGIGSLLVRDTSNVHWITALDGIFDEERAHGLLIAGGRAYLHTDSRYANAVRSGAASIGSDIIVSEDRVGHPQFARNVLTRNGTAPIAGKLGIEDTITYAEFVKMVECFTTDALAPTTDVVLGLRAVKDAGEITRLKAAQAITDAAFTHIVGYMRPGMTEREVQLELEDFMVRHGAEGLSFRSIVATGPNGADPHAVPGSTVLEAGQCVVMDFGAKAYGYCSDMTRTVFLGRPQGAMAAAWETLRRANETVEAMLKPGVIGADAHALAERILEEGGFGGRMGHGLGHGVGLDVHELPVLNPRNKTALVAGNVVTVEPGIYFPGKFGMRLEDFGVVTQTGFEVFTQSTHEMVII